MSTRTYLLQYEWEDTLVLEDGEEFNEEEVRRWSLDELRYYPDGFSFRLWKEEFNDEEKALLPSPGQESLELA